MSHPEVLTVPLRPLTGLWTGSADSKKMTDLKATSLLGGLRFWTEALLRAEGKEACDISNNEKRCLKKKGREVCPACGIFGCTGLGRSFLLKVNAPAPDSILSKPTQPEVRLEERAYDDPKSPGQKKIPRYYLPKGYEKEFSLSLVPNRPLDGRLTISAHAALALLLMIEYGALGAQDQYGCGLVVIDSKDAQERLRALALEAVPVEARPSFKPGLSLRDFFFFKASSRDGDARRTMCLTRCDIRNSFRASDDKGFRHWFCGSLKDKAGSKFNLGVYGGTLHGWGWFPRDQRDYKDRREAALDAVRNVLGILWRDVRWKEFGAERDNCGSPKTWPEFLRNMASTPWRSAV